MQAAFKEAETRGLIVSTCHPRRFDPPFLKTKAYLENRAALQTDFDTSSELGEVVGFEFNFDYHQPSKRGLHHSLMFDHLNHEVDAMHFLFGFGELTNLIKRYDGETEFKVTGQRTDGITFTFTGARHRKERIYPEDMIIRFTNGSLAIDLHAGKAVLESGDQIYTKMLLSRQTTPNDLLPSTRIF
jgi:predicted dehydrogenase